MGVVPDTEASLRELIRDLQVGVLVLGPQGEVRLANQAALALLGLSEGALIGQRFPSRVLDVRGEDDRPIPPEARPLGRAFDTRQPVHDVVLSVYRRATDDQAWLLVNAQPQLAEDGSVRQVICTLTDLTR